MEIFRRIRARRRMRAALLAAGMLAVMAFGASAFAADSSVAGDWEGTLDTGAGTLRVVIHVSKDKDGKLTGSLDSPDQGASGIPISSMTYNAPDLHFEVEQVSGKYEGKMNKENSEISGTWTQPGGSLSLNFKRTGK